MNTSSIGIIGLGVMGSNLALNIAENGFTVSVYNRSMKGEEDFVSKFISDNDTFNNITGYTILEEFVHSLEIPRKIIIMIKAGQPVDEVISDIIPLLSEGDVLIDGGNSHYSDTQRRYHYLKNKKINFLGCGISGGEVGARNGPSLMPGGNCESYNLVSHVLEAISAKDKNFNPCCSYIGDDGAGHFVKMVHNGIEYVEMQLLSELYHILSVSMDNLQIAKVLSEWNKTDLSSYLLEITIEILTKKRDDDYLIDLVLDKAGNKGTGSWSSVESFNLGCSSTLMASAVYARFTSALKERRTVLSGKKLAKIKFTHEPNINVLKRAYRFSRHINQHQGFELLKLASDEYKWNLNLSEIARLWTNGCIIRSDFMEKSVDVLLDNVLHLDDKIIFNRLNFYENDIKELLELGLKNRIPLDCFWSAYNYWVSMTTQNLPANLIQLQRDYFGAHTYQLKNDETGNFYHTKWAEQ